MAMVSFNANFILVGNTCAGKTSLVNVFIQKGFSDAYTTTGFRDTRFDTLLGNKNFCLKLCDTSGRQEFDNLRESLYHKADVVLLCFSLGSKVPLGQVIHRFLPEIMANTPFTPKVILVGCQMDRRSEQAELGMISYAEGRDRAKMIGCYAYMECSAKTEAGINAVFEMAARAVLELPDLTTTEKSSSKENIAETMV